jgi:L-aminopeptidase/D-esterase-like protein
VPIVPAAVLFDLDVGRDPKRSVRPRSAGIVLRRPPTTGPVAEGNVGAGAGATIGKFAGSGRAMKSGLGSAAIVLPDGLIVAALVAVNALGDVIDPATGAVVAGGAHPGRGENLARRAPDFQSRSTARRDSAKTRRSASLRRTPGWARPRQPRSRK